MQYLTTCLHWKKHVMLWNLVSDIYVCVCVCVCVCGCAVVWLCGCVCPVRWAVCVCECARACVSVSVCVWVGGGGGGWGGYIFIMITTTLHCGHHWQVYENHMPRVHPSHMMEIEKMETVWTPVSGWASTMSQIIVTEGLSVPVLFNSWSHWYIYSFTETTIIDCSAINTV